MTNTDIKMPEMTENFADLLNEQFGDNGILGTVVKGTIIKVSPDFFMSVASQTANARYFYKKL